MNATTSGPSQRLERNGWSAPLWRNFTLVLATLWFLLVATGLGILIATDYEKRDAALQAQAEMSAWEKSAPSDQLPIAEILDRMRDIMAPHVEAPEAALLDFMADEAMTASLFKGDDNLWQMTTPAGVIVLCSRDTIEKGELICTGLRHTAGKDISRNVFRVVSDMALRICMERHARGQF